MTSISDEIEAYAAYLNAPRDHLDDDDRRMVDEDTAKARAAMTAAWLELIPTAEARTPPRSRSPSRMAFSLIIVGLILLIVGYVLPNLGVLVTLGLVLLVVGLVLLVVSAIASHRP
jgi:peptidoglycan/LPS O-acetylase OafA/YrhL